MSNQGFLPVPVSHGSDVEHRRVMSNAINELRDGKINATGSVTLTASAASTAVTDARVGGNSMVLFMPSTANAAAEQGAGTMYVSSVGKQTFTITHANNSQSDRTFSYAVFG